MNEYATKEKDLQKGISRIPLEMCRMSDQDLVNLDHLGKRPTDSTESGSHSGTYEISERASENAERNFSVSGIPLVQMTEDIEEHIRQRGRAQRSLKKSRTSDEDSDDILSHTSGDRSQSLFCRSSECEMVNLEDFQLVSILGKGSFGKVYLVYLPKN